MTQFTTTYPLDRAYHVWHDRKDGTFKCVLCGAVTTSPVNVEAKRLDIERYELLTDDERNLAPPEDNHWPKKEVLSTG